MKRLVATFFLASAALAVAHRNCGPPMQVLMMRLAASIVLFCIGLACLAHAQIFPGPGLPVVVAAACTANTQGGGTYSNVIGLWHFDTPSGLTDSSANGHNLTLTGTASISSAQAKFGASALLSAVSSGATMPSSANLAIGTGAFTLEGWLYMTSNPSLHSWIGDAASTFADNSSSTQAILWISGNNAINTTFATGAWHHHAWVRSGSTFTFYLDGVSQGTTTTSASLGNSSAGWALGNGYGTNGTYYLPGYLDEVRVSNVARYTSGFTPNPNGAFCNS
jgi:hypothetical protein